MSDESPEKNRKSSFEKLKDLLPAELCVVDYKDLPPFIKDFFEGKSAKFIRPESYMPGDFEKIFKFSHANGDVTFVAQQYKTYVTKEASPELLTHFADTRGGVITGYLELRFSSASQREYFINKPFAGYTETSIGFQGQGLGRRRLEEANKYALAEHGYSLNSDTILDDEELTIWNKLVADGVAEQYDENGKIRFRFI